MPRAPSKMEKEMAVVLNQLKEDGVLLEIIPECQANVGRCRFDFRIISPENQHAIIEMDGEFHFKPVMFQFMKSGKKRFMGAKKANQIFREVRTNDARKNNWCRENGLPFLRIAYDAAHYRDLVLAFLKRLKEEPGFFYMTEGPYNPEMLFTEPEEAEPEPEPEKKGKGEKVAPPRRIMMDEEGNVLGITENGIYTPRVPPPIIVDMLSP